VGVFRVLDLASDITDKSRYLWVSEQLMKVDTAAFGSNFLLTIKASQPRDLWRRTVKGKLNPITGH
jgi:hypothetical protein